MDKDLKIHRENYLNVTCYKNSVFKVWSVLLLSSRGLARLRTVRNLPSLTAGGCFQAMWFSGTPPRPAVWQTSRSAWIGEDCILQAFARHLCVTRTLTSHHHSTPPPPPTFEKKFFYSVPCPFEYLLTLDCVVRVQHLLKVRGSVSGLSRGVSLCVSWVGLFCPRVTMWFPDERKEVQLPPLSQMTFVSACSLSSIALSSQSINKCLLSVYHECPVQAGALRVFLRGGRRRTSSDSVWGLLKACYKMDVLWGFIKMTLWRVQNSSVFWSRLFLRIIHKDEYYLMSKVS